MCGENITSTEGRYKVWIDSRSGTSQTTDPLDLTLCHYDNIPIFNIHPKFQKSLVYVKQFWITGKDAPVVNNLYVISIEGKSFPNNYQTQKIGQSRLQDEEDAINADTNSRVLCACPENEYTQGSGMYFGGSASHDGVLCGDTFVNSGGFSVRVQGVDLTQTSYLIELEIQLIENVKTENPNVIKYNN